MRTAAVVRVAPFAVYLLWMGIASVLHWLGTSLPLWLYPLKAGSVALVLAWFWDSYTELRVARPGLAEMWAAFSAGIVVYVLWVRMDWSWAVVGQPEGYNPFEAGAAGPLLAGSRVLGAALVVPVMEELFWRSFLIRYLIADRFETVPLGTFTPLSCVVTVVLFGLEHDLWLAGMMAGAVYTGLLYWRRNLWLPIVAHGTTNLALAVHVLMTGEWRWW